MPLDTYIPMTCLSLFVSIRTGYVLGNVSGQDMYVIMEMNLLHNRFTSEIQAEVSVNVIRAC
jgi:hypothetical protein